MPDAATRAPDSSGPASRPPLGETFRTHAKFVYGVLRRHGVPDPLLDDAVQDVFMVVHHRFERYDPQTPMRSWLFGIARRVAADHRRAQQRSARRRPPRRDAPEDPETRFATQEALAFVQRFIDGLPAIKREVFVLTEIEGMTAPEVAAALGIKINTVYSRLHDTRAAFQRAVARRTAREQRR